MARVSAVDAAERVFDALAEAIVEDLGVAMAAVWIFEPAENRVVLKATAGIPGYRERVPPTLSPYASTGIARVAMTREPEIIPEIGPESGFKDPAWLASVGIRAYAGVPLVLNEQGCGGVSAFAGTPWPEGLVEAITLLAQHAALAVEHGRLLEESQTLQEIAATVAATRDPDQLLGELVKRTRAAFGADGCAAWLVADDQSPLLPAAADGLSEAFLRRSSQRTARPVSALFNEVARTGRPLYTRDDRAEALARSPQLADLLAVEGIVSALRLPLFEPGGRVAGMLALYHRHERRYTEDEVRLAQAFTNQIAVALHNARLALMERQAQAAARRQLDRLAQLSRVTELLLASHDLPSVEKVVVEAAVALCNARASVLALVKPGQQRLLRAATCGDMHAWFDSFAEPYLEEAYAHPSPTGEAITTGRTVLVSDYLARPAVSSAQVVAREAGVRSLIAAPVRKSGSLLGMLWVADTEPNSLTEEDAVVIESLADQAALALEQARLLDESHTLQVIAAELASTREPQEMIEAIVTRSAAALSADGCALWLADHEEGRITLGAASGLTPRFWSRTTRLMAEDRQAALAAYRSLASMVEPVYSADDQARVRGASAAIADALAEEGVTSALRLPLFDPEGLVTGMLALYHRRERVYSDSELRLAQAFADQIAVGLHNAHLSEKERQAQASARRQVERLQVITRITERLLGATELEEVLRVVIGAAARLSGASGAMIGLVDDEGQRLTAVAFEGEPRSIFERFGTPLLDERYLRDTASGRALASRSVVVVEDYAAWPGNHEMQQLAVREGIRSFVAAPLVLGANPIGVLWVHDTKARTFAPDDVELIEALADQAALAIEHVRLAQRGQDAAVLEERTRLARDLHDSVTQSVFSLGMMARAAQTQHVRGSDRLGTTLERIADLSSDALREMRALLFELQPTGLAEEGLTGALRRLTEAVRTRTELDVCFEGESEARLAAPVETAVFRIVQEALANAGKHAKATTITVALTELPAMLRICVQDNGVGFDPSAPVAVTSADGRRGGMGMRTMQERAAASGLRLSISSAPGEGTSITIEAPRPGEAGPPAETAAARKRGP